MFQQASLVPIPARCLAARRALSLLLARSRSGPWHGGGCSASQARYLHCFLDCARCVSSRRGITPGMFCLIGGVSACVHRCDHWCLSFNEPISLHRLPVYIHIGVRSRLPHSLLGWMIQARLSAGHAWNPDVFCICALARLPTQRGKCARTWPLLCVWEILVMTGLTSSRSETVWSPENNWERQVLRHAWISRAFTYHMHSRPSTVSCIRSLGWLGRIQLTSARPVHLLLFGWYCHARTHIVHSPQCVQYSSFYCASSYTARPGGPMRLKVAYRTHSESI